jgi:uncharacterized protein (TIGR03083 family)
MTAQGTDQKTQDPEPTDLRSSRLDTLVRASDKFSRLAEGNLDLAVAACPGWSVADLVGHLGGVYSWAVMVMAAGGERPAAKRASAPEQRELLLEWFAKRRDDLVDSVSSLPPDAAAWSFSTRSDATVSWWLRRQAYETAIHLHDLEEAVSYSPDSDPSGAEANAVSSAAAADGADEVLTDIAPTYLDRNPSSELAGSLHVHATDTPGEWIVNFDAKPVLVGREHAKADAAVRGPARSLLLWLWNRRPLDESALEVFGNLDIARSWEHVRI